MPALAVAIIGAGYWGPNLVRNFSASPDWNVVAICDRDADRAARLAAGRPGVDVVTSTAELFARTDLDAVAIATPAATHAELALSALAAGLHVLVEKPLAHSVEAGAAMVEAAREAGRILMIDHTFCYTPAVSYIAGAIADGQLGDVLYVDSTRINLGLVQPDVNVFWDLAPHDLSILDRILPGGLEVGPVTATGADPLNTGKACLGNAILPLRGGASASVSVNWLSPTKIRTFVVGGSQRTLVWDDVNPTARIALYDRGVDVAFNDGGPDDRAETIVSYRKGDIVIPTLVEREALSAMVAEFAAAIHEDRPPLTDGECGLRVLRVLDAIDTSLAEGRAVQPVQEVRV